MTSWSAVDGVVIAVPHTYHYEIARDALDAGVHVLVEKPMVLTSAHAWDLVRRAEEKGLELMVGTTFQFTEAGPSGARNRAVRRHRRPPARIGAVRVDGGETSCGANPRAYKPMFDYPVTGPEPKLVLRPEDFGRRSGTDPALTRDGHGLLGNRTARDRGIRLHGELRPLGGPGRRHQLPARQRAR